MIQSRITKDLVCYQGFQLKLITMKLSRKYRK
jgi:hypothetical protein